MDYSDWLNKQIDNRITEKDIACRTCEFNFNGICAAHGSFWGYGEDIKNDSLWCDEWGISLDYYIYLAKEIEKQRSVEK